MTVVDPAWDVVPPAGPQRVNRQVYILCALDLSARRDGGRRVDLRRGGAAAVTVTESVTAHLVGQVRTKWQIGICPLAALPAAPRNSPRADKSNSAAMPSKALTGHALGAAQAPTPSVLTGKGPLR
jgi:hypothetical protein